jgi:DNA helicase II / ATP-dependent DNA helicase PcrA
MQSPGDNVAILAVAGARKTETIIEAALAEPNARTLITTYTTENLRQIARRIRDRTGVIPAHIRVSGWFSFLLSEAIRPYQHAVFSQVGLVRGLNFEGKRQRFAHRGDRHYYLDSRHDVYKDGMADLACYADAASGGAVSARLEHVFDRIFVDEVQDLVGYDLDFLDLMFKSRIAITVVGDPRQYTIATNQTPKNKKYRGAGLADWLAERSSYCEREDRSVSVRCSQGICDFASALFPGLPALEAGEDAQTSHHGIHQIEPHEVHDYFEAHHPVVLRNSKSTATLGYPAINIGVAKGSTFDRVLIFPTKPMKQYLADGDLSKLKAPERLYVAVTRARHSATFVI